jgi:hypothetical protein
MQISAGMKGSAAYEDRQRGHRLLDVEIELQDLRHEHAKAIARHVEAEVHRGQKKDRAELPHPREMTMVQLAGILPVELVTQPAALVGRQPGRLLRPVGEEKERQHSRADRSDTLDDEDPPPPLRALACRAAKESSKTVNR